MERKIVEVSLEEPSLKSGGGIGIIQSLESLVLSGDVLYVGPEFQENSVKLKSKFFISHKYRIIDTLIGLTKGITTGYYSDWNRIKKKINFSNYDIMHIEFTRYPFLIPNSKKFDGVIVVRVHNIERDYFWNLFLNKKSVKNYMRYFFYSRAEKKMMSKANVLVCLTDEDKNRLLDVYSNEVFGKKIVVNPVCISDRYVENNRNYNKRGCRFLITGSLWYGPNLDGILWFIDNVWSHVTQQNLKLIIAGANPSPVLCTRVREFKNIELTASPENIDEFFNNCDYYIAPVFVGAGMKVKIAEAMMFGLPIIASSHALIGYELCSGILRANSKEEFIDAIKQFSSVEQAEWSNYSETIRRHYLTNYSIESSALRMREIINS